MSKQYEKPIDELIPAGVKLTDLQKENLEGVIRTMKRWDRDHVKKSDIASIMKKETGAVSSGLQPLIKKGILEINDDAEVVFAEKKAEEPKPAPKKTAAPKKAAAPKNAATPKKAAAKPAAGKAESAKSAPLAEEAPAVVVDARGSTAVTMELLADYVKCKKLVIPEGVVSIESSAFAKSKAETVILPQSLRSIGRSAFYMCNKLKEIVLPEGLEAIGGNAFIGCTSLRDINVPDSIRDVDEYAFADHCGHNKSLTIHLSTGLAQRFIQSMKTQYSDPPVYGFRFDIGGEFFKNLKAYQDYCKKHPEQAAKSAAAKPAAEASATPEEEETPADIKEWLDRILNGDDREPDELETECGELGLSCWNDEIEECENKDVEEIVIPDGVTGIMDNAFEDCTRLRSVSIPDTVTHIGMSAFKGCVSLEEIELPDSITEIEGWTFEGCKALKKAKLPSGITKIGYSMFNGCESLTDLEIPDGVTEIEGQAFIRCASLTELALPDSIEKIGMWAFDSCSSLETVYMPDKEIEFESEFRMIPEKTEVIRIPVGDQKARKAAKQANATDRYTKVTPSDELYSHYGKLKREHEKFSGMGIRHVSNNGREHEAIPLAALMERQGKTDNGLYRRLKSFEAADRYDLKDLALKMAQVFRVNESVFDSRHDVEGDIGVTMLDYKWKFSALRSFAWTLADMADREGKTIDDYDEADLSAVCGFIKKRQWLNYEEGSWFDGLCGHADIHVYYMPQQMIADGSADEVCSVFSYCPIVSLEAFRNDLNQLRNPMIRLHNKLLKGRDRSVKLDSPEAAVLHAWCSMVMSAETPFFSEDGPMVFFHDYPKTPANTQPIPLGAKTAAPKKAAPKAKKEEASSGMQSAASYEIVKGPDGKCRVKLGNYPAGHPIVWLVLENNKSDLLLISEYGLDTQAFHDTSLIYEKTGSFGDSTNEWHNCTLREWLNDQFSKAAFSPEEWDMVLEDTHDTYKMSSGGVVEETPAVKDKVFLLSAREAKKYFPTQRDLICKATEYAKQQGAEIEGGPMQCHWWCRSPAVALLAGLNQWAGCIMATGEGKGWGTSAGNICVRPVIRVKADGFKNTSAVSLSGKGAVAQAEEQVEEIRKTAKEALDHVHQDVENTKSALEKHAENLREQEREKEKRIQAAKARGKTDKDETDMLVILLNEESLGFLQRPEDEFVEIYAEDFGAYNESQLKKLRKKVLPRIHDQDYIEAAKEDMLSRPVKDRFTVSTANWFNVSNHWNFKEKGEMAIENTRLWYRDDELDEVRSLMENHKKEGCDSVNNQLSAFNGAWVSFDGVKNDLHIDITETDEEASPKHSLFDVKLNAKLRVQVILKHPSMGFITIPAMSLFASVWKVSPEQIWNAALNNPMDDSRGVSARTKTDAAAAKAKALEQISPARSGKPAAKNAVPSNQASRAGNGSQDADRIRGEIARLERERDSVKGLFGGLKRRRIQGEIDALKEQLRRL